ncbi:hypothetical protein [Holophaga foetida]|uniref:hypothetical protein n=1 Tax=Holophaga foetida TaxID=35839 RepID=UPI0002472A49|nr:hypothetical protein [Holophaga foetida]
MNDDQSGAVVITVDYQYDIHSIRLSGRTYARIKAGKPVTIRGQGFFNEERWEVDRWRFNHGDQGTVCVFTDEGRDIFEGYLDAGDVWVDSPEL